MLCAYKDIGWHLHIFRISLAPKTGSKAENSAGKGAKGTHKQRSSERKIPMRVCRVKWSKILHFWYNTHAQRCYNLSRGSCLIQGTDTAVCKVRVLWEESCQTRLFCCLFNRLRRWGQPFCEVVHSHDPRQIWRWTRVYTVVVPTPHNRDWVWMLLNINDFGNTIYMLTSALDFILCILIPSLYIVYGYVNWPDDNNITLFIVYCVS